MSKVLDGKVAVVVGSGQGIGRGIAIGLVSEGASVVTNNRKPGSTGVAMLEKKHRDAMGSEKSNWVDKEIQAISGDAETTAAYIREQGGKAVAFFGDVSDYDVAGGLIKTAIDNYGKIDILVNVAGAFGICPFEELTPELWEKVTTVKPRGYFNTMRQAIPYMMEQKWGRILNATSRAANGDGIRHAEYCAANAGVVGLTKAVAIEMWEYGITCNAFGPFALTRASYELDTMGEAAGKSKKVWITGEHHKGMLEETPGPEYVAPFICYLASDAGAGVSGSVFELGGNRVSLISEPVLSHNLVKFDDKPWTVEEFMNQAPVTLFAGYTPKATLP